MRLELFFIAMVASAAPPVIGTVVAKGSFQIDNSTVTGNATLLSGSSIETQTASSFMHLASGARVSLGSESRGKFFGDHMILEKGEGRLERGRTFRVEARGLTIQPETVDSSAKVALAGAKQVDVAALVGSFRILNSRGLLVAKLEAGKALEFEPQFPEGPSKVLGCLRKIDAHFVLLDETTNVVVELAGPGLEKEAGNRIEVTGSADAAATAVPNASLFLRVNRVKRISKGCGSESGISAAAAAGAGGAAGASAGASSGAGGGAAAGTASFATPIAIVGGVAATATVSGLAAAGKLPGQESAPSPISR